MRIAIIIDSVGVRAGIERVTASLADIWTDLGYKVVFITKDSRKPVYPVSKKVKFVSLGISSDFSQNRFTRYIQKAARIFTAARSIKKHFKTHTYDFTYSASPDNTLSLYFAGALGASKVIASEHGAYEAYNRFFKIMKYWVYPKVHAVIALTYADTEKYRRFNQSSYCIPNPLGFSSKKTSSLKNKRALAVGRLVADKAYPRMLEIWERISASHPDWELLIIGSGECESSIKDEIRRRGLTKKVKLKSKSADIVEEYLNASVYLMTSTGEGFGMVLVEAMECGLPVIAFDCSAGPREILTNGGGILIENGNIEAYTAELEHLTADALYRKSAALAGKKKAERYRRDAITKMWRTMYEEVL